MASRFSWSIIRGGPVALIAALKGRLKGFLREPHSRACYSQEGEDQVLVRIFDGVQGGFYVDVGAHHPWRFSNTYLFYLRGWTGINIEPNPVVQRLFAQHRPGDRNIQCGVAEAAGRLTYHYFDEPALNTFDAGLARERVERTSYKLLGTQEVAVERLDEILGRSLAPGQRIDFLSVDVEGLDLAVLRSNDWSRYRPRIVLAEALDSMIETAINGELCVFMRSHGYRLFAKTYNTMFFVDALDPALKGLVVKPDRVVPG